MDSQLILTKGDNNPVDDTTMYSEGQAYLRRDEIIGFVRGYVPFLGWIVIILQDTTKLPEVTRMALGRVGVL